ncbi:site-2 protease family protein [Fibrobacterota bacterium]
MKGSWKIGSLAGVGIQVHFTFLLLAGLIFITTLITGQGLAVALAGLVFLALIFSLVVLHELGHALTARHFGIYTRDITLLPIGGVANLVGEVRRPGHEILIALAGPAVNLALAVLFVLFWLVSSAAPTDGVFSASTVLGQLVYINIALAVFNLLPAFPMDGGRVLRAVMWLRMDRLRATEIAVNIGKVVTIGMAILGVFYNPFLILIAFFIWFAGSSELNALRLQRVSETYRYPGNLFEYPYIVRYRPTWSRW